MQRKTIYLFLELVICFSFSVAFGQQRKVDSLTSLLANETKGLNKAGILVALSEQFIISGDFALARQYADKAFSICETQLPTSKDQEKLAFLREKANAYNMIAIVYRYWGEYPKAIENHLAALKIREQLGDKKGLARSYLGLGSISRFQGNYEEALRHYSRSFKLYSEIGFKLGIANTLIHIGEVHRDMHNYPEALKHYIAAQKIWQEIDNKKGIADSYNAIGLIYSKQGKYEDARTNYLLALKINEKLEYKDEAIKTFINLGSLNIQVHEFTQAKKYLDTALTLATSIGSRDDLKEIYKAISEMAIDQKDFEAAYKNYQKFILIRDSLVNQGTSEKITQMQIQYTQDKKDTLVREEKRRQKIITYSASFALLLTLLLSFVIYRGYRNKQNSNVLLSEKNKVIEDKNKNITDSISYAKRLQQAILPSQELISKWIPENFVLYKPKDIVAGDFYWMESLDGFVYIAAADSTGHGVPGAMVSVVCSNALNRAVKEFGLRNTSEILDKTRELVIETFAQSNEEVKDGMDISLIRIRKANGNTEIQWSGAYNSLWFYKDDAFNEIKANKQPIGKHDNPEPFTSHTQTFASTVTFYLFSDGYADQFSAENKKLMTRKFKEILGSIQHLSMEEQGKHLSEFHDEWKGTMEQTDDVLVIGLRV